MYDTSPIEGATPVELCAGCFPGAPPVIAVTAEISVVRWNGLWHLVTSPGESNDLIATFTGTPQMDPTAGMTEDEVNASDDSILDAMEAWFAEASAAMAQLGALGLRRTWRLVEHLCDAGYDPRSDGEAEFWLYRHIAAAIARHQNS